MNKLGMYVFSMSVLLLLFIGNAFASCNFNDTAKGLANPISFPGNLGPVTGLKQLGGNQILFNSPYSCRFPNGQATLTISEAGGLNGIRSTGPHQIDPSGRQLYNSGIEGIYVSFSVGSAEGGALNLHSTPTSSGSNAFSDSNNTTTTYMYAWQDTNFNPAISDMSKGHVNGAIMLDFNNNGNSQQQNFDFAITPPAPMCDASASIESASGSGGLIPLGTFTAPVVNNGETPQTPFTLHLTGCFSVNTIGLTLTGTAAATDKSLLGQSTPGADGAAAGVGVKISTAAGNYNVNAGTQIKVNDGAAVDFSVDPNQTFDGTRDIKLNAQLVRDGTSAASGGEVSAVGTFTFNAD